MAVGLAVLQWGALVDGMDVEFVLGGHSSNAGSAAPRDQGRRQTQLWILDFDKAAKLQLPGLSGTTSSQTEGGWLKFGDTGMCAQMLKAVTTNGPCLPTPHVHSEMDNRCQGDDDYVDLVVWGLFEEAYVKAARVLIPENRTLMGSELPIGSLANHNMAASRPKEFVRMWKARGTKERGTEDGRLICLDEP